MKNQLMRSKFMYYFIIIFTILILIGNFVILMLAINLTKPLYTKTINNNGWTETLTYDSPIYPILKTNQVILIAVFLLISIGLFGYFLYCFVTNKPKTSKILGIILFGLTSISLLIRLKILIAVLPLLVVGYLLNIKTNIVTKSQK